MVINVVTILNNLKPKINMVVVSLRYLCYNKEKNDCVVTKFLTEITKNVSIEEVR